MIKTKIKGFSLIELLVIVVIIGVLSALAVAQYSSYSIKAKMAQGMVILENIGELTKVFYDTHGAFPTLQDIGLAFDPMDPTQSPMANTLSDYQGQYVAYTFLVDEGSGFTCPAAAYGGYISNLSGGDFLTVNQNGSLVAVTSLLVYINETFNRYCQYFYMQYDPVSQNTTYVSGNFIAGCENGADDPDSGNFFVNAGNQC